MAIVRGFLLGKFMPPHTGHIFLCDVASELVDELTVLVCSRDSEPIDGHLRSDWMRDSVKGNVRVLHLHQDIPQDPSEHPDFWDIWVETINKLHPEPIDIVFGSEDYILRLANELNSQPLVVDKGRTIVSVSATEVRENPEAYWDYLPQTVRPYYQNRICILGPESTGKSQLSQYLAAHFDTRHVPEYGRTYDEVLKKGDNWQIEDFIAIAQSHRAIQSEVSVRSGPLCFEDTDLIQTIVWSEYLLGEVPESLHILLKTWSFADYYLLLKPNVDWHNDGTRYSGDAAVRNWFDKKLKALLVEINLPFTYISDVEWSAREESALQAVSRFIKNK